MATFGLEKKTTEELHIITKEVVDKVLAEEHLAVSKIILYGSYARGDADDESDIDIMVLCNNTEDDIEKFGREVRKQAWQIGFDHDIVIQTIVKEEDFFQYWVDVIPFYRNVRDEGVCLYG